MTRDEAIDAMNANAEVWNRRLRRWCRIKSVYRRTATIDVQGEGLRVEQRITHTAETLHNLKAEP